MPNEEPQFVRFITNDILTKLEDGANGCVLTFGALGSGKSKIFK